ncbi:ribosomal protein S5 domain 2-like protein [Apodospora peruviana]|uniref:Ribosomal RNA-processing protein 43 n=1 Tax=Apodospora peruviana TaxID=516989 RepID=A0AAE0IU03_9PEZI|nr:ribosomal protein S5 domain 2-like protein [Apodospora peruviana]
MAASPPTLSFPRPTFAKLSPHPYLLAGLAAPDSASRSNGRAPHEARPIHIHTSSLSHAHGSALVRSGDTTVVCGVRGEILPVTSIPQYRPTTSYNTAEEERSAGLGRGELRDYDLLVPNIELATGCAPQFLPGVPPTTLAQTLSTRVYSLLHSCKIVDPAAVRIWYHPSKVLSAGDEDEKVDDDDDNDGDNGDEEERRTKPQLMAYWVLYIDLLFVSLDGNPFDAAWAAVLAALRDTKLPEARWDPDLETVVCESKKAPMALQITGVPVACTAAVFLEKEHAELGGKQKKNRHWILLDPDRLEAELCQEVVTVVVDCEDGSGETRIKSIEKQGGTVIGRELMRGFVGVAEQRWKEVRKML